MTPSDPRRSPRASRALLGGFLLAAASMTLAPAAAHADGELGLSPDGVHWSDELSAPLFDAHVRWVPGDVRSAHFYVRNQAADLGRLSVAVQRTATSPLVSMGDVDVEVRAGSSAWAPLTTAAPQQIPGADDLATDRPVLVSVRVTFAPQSRNVTMAHGADLAFLVRLSDARVVEAATGPTDDGPIRQAGSQVSVGAASVADGERAPDQASGVLPFTGNTVDESYVWLGFVLVGAGTFLVARRRREQDGADRG